MAQNLNDKALAICKMYHDKLLTYYKSGTADFTNADLQPLREAHMEIYNNTFSLCCSGTINNGLKSLSSAYFKHLNNG